jgi:hypothetical protein
MTFKVTDLMVNVVPAMASACGPATSTPPAPPCPDPSCAKNSAKAQEAEYAGLKLPPLPALRTELRQALHA